MGSMNFYKIVFVIAVIINVFFSIKGWDEPPLDAHHFRQSQTAITSYYTIKEGFRTDYITPVFGAPWSLPMEFPLYQWIVSVIVIIFKSPLVQSGRFVSLLFFYFSLLPIYSILNQITKNKQHSLIFLSILLLSPTYIYWSRTFMIESTAFFLSIVFLWGYISTLSKKHSIVNKFSIIALIAAILASMVKITTLAVYVYAAMIFTVWYWLKEDRERRFSGKVIFKYSLHALFYVIIIAVFSVSWIKYCDSVKLQNPMAFDFLTSYSLNEWYMETFISKFSLENWNQIFYYTLMIPKFLGSINTELIRIPYIIVFIIFVTIVISHLIFNKQRRFEILFCISAFFTAPLAFTKLHFIHVYYNYPNMIFLYFAVGFFLLSFIESSNDKIHKAGKFILLPLIFVIIFFSYMYEYYPLQKMNLNYPAVVEIVKNSTMSEDVILIYGQDWDPTLPLGMERKTLMDRWNLPLNSEKIQNSLRITGKNTIKGMLLSGNYDTLFIKERIDYFGFKAIPIYSDNQFKFYIK